jgi:hypothetical protein
VVILEGLLGAGIRKPTAAQIVVIRDQAEQVRALDLDGGQLVLVVLRKGARGSVPLKKQKEFCIYSAYRYTSGTLGIK